MSWMCSACHHRYMQTYVCAVCNPHAVAEALCRELRKAQLGLLLRQDVERQGVGLAVEVLEQGVVEDGVVGGSS